MSQKLDYILFEDMEDSRTHSWLEEPRRCCRWEGWLCRLSNQVSSCNEHRITSLWAQRKRSPIPFDVQKHNTQLVMETHFIFCFSHCLQSKQRHSCNKIINIALTTCLQVLKHGNRYHIQYRTKDCWMPCQITTGIRVMGIHEFWSMKSGCNPSGLRRGILMRWARSHENVKRNSVQIVPKFSWDSLSCRTAHEPISSDCFSWETSFMREPDL